MVMKMLRKGNENRVESEIVCIGDLVPMDHLLRIIEAAVDFAKIYEIVEALYNKNTSFQFFPYLKSCLIKSALFGFTQNWTGYQML